MKRIQLTPRYYSLNKKPATLKEAIYDRIDTIIEQL